MGAHWENPYNHRRYTTSDFSGMAETYRITAFNLKIWEQAKPKGQRSVQDSFPSTFVQKVEDTIPNYVLSEFETFDFRDWADLLLIGSKQRDFNI